MFLRREKIHLLFGRPHKRSRLGLWGHVRAFLQPSSFHFFSLVSNAESAMQGCAARWPDIGPEVSPELVVSELGLLGF
jgi:hypothetical protein